MVQEGTNTSPHSLPGQGLEMKTLLFAVSAILELCRKGNEEEEEEEEGGGGGGEVEHCSMNHQHREWSNSATAVFRSNAFGSKTLSR